MAAGTGVCFCSIRRCKKKKKKMGDKSKMSNIYTDTIHGSNISITVTPLRHLVSF